MAILLYKWLFTFFVAGIISTTTIHSNKNVPVHPFFISVTEISHNAADKNIEISCKIFTDDLETALAKSNGTKIDLSNPGNKQAAEKQITAYLKKHLVIKLDSKAVALEFVGFERENEAIWSYLQVPNTVSPKKIEIMNDLLYEAFSEQINLMHVSVGGNRKSIKLNYPDATASFQF